MIALALVFAFPESPKIVGKAFECAYLEGKSPFGDSAVEQELRVRRSGPVLQRRGPGLHLDIHHPVLLTTGADWIAAVGRIPPTSQPDHVPYLAIHHDLGDRAGPRDKDVLSVLGALAVLLCIFAMFSPNMAGVVALVAVSFCLSLMFPTIYGVALQGTRSCNEIRRSRTGDGDRRWGDHALMVKAACSTRPARRSHSSSPLSASPSSLASPSSISEPPRTVGERA